MTFLCRKRRIINDAHQWLRVGGSQEQKDRVLREASNSAKIRGEVANPSLCPLHFRGESEEESNIVASVIKITPGEKNPQDV